MTNKFTSFNPKPALILLGLCCFSLLNAQILHTENFDNSVFPPQGWFKTGDTSYLYWTNTGVNPTQSPYSGLGEVEYDSYYAPIDDSALLISPVVDWSNLGTDTATISFWFYRDATAYNTTQYDSEGVYVMINTTPTSLGATTIGFVPRMASANPIVGSTGWYQYTFQVPTSFNTATNYMIFRFYSQYGDNCHFDALQWLAFPPDCNGVPAAGNVTASVNPVCPLNPFQLSLQNTLELSGISYQWQSSSDSFNWQNLTNDTLAVMSDAISAATYYRCVVNCSFSGLSDTAIILMSLNPYYLCYCTPSASSCTNGDDITNVTFAGINNSSACSVNGYAQYPSPPATVQQWVSYPISVTVGNGGQEFVSAWIDFNQNGIYEASEYTYLGMATNATINASIVVPSNAVIGTAGMRIMVQNGAATPDSGSCFALGLGETEDYTVNILAAPPCTNPAIGGFVSGADTATLGPVFMYIDSGSSGNIQWQYSSTSANGSFTNINGANSDTLNYTFNGIGTYWFRAYLTSPGCYPDSSNVYQTVVTFPGDNVCNAVPLSFGVNGPFSTLIATVQAGEPSPPATGCYTQNGWCDTSLHNTLWFTFVAPASGRIKIQSPGFDTKLAVWSAATCDTILHGGATLLAANDNDFNYAADSGVVFSSLIDSVVCLMPGQTYYVQLSAAGSPGGTTTIVLTDLGSTSSVSFAIAPLYCSNHAAVQLVPSVSGGVFSGSGISNNIFYPDSAATGASFLITYTLNACFASDTTFVDGTPSLSNTATNVSCFGLSDGTIITQVSGGTPGYAYNWNNGVQTGDLLGIAIGTYVLTVTDTLGCSAVSDTFQIAQPTALLMTNDSVVEVLCGGDSSGIIYISVNGGTTPYQFIWSNGSNDSILVSVPEGTYALTITDANNCSLTVSNTIDAISPGLGTNTTIVQPLLNGTPGSINQTATGGIAPFRYRWSTGDTTQNLSNLSIGIYQCTITDALGCMEIVSDTLTVSTGILQSENEAYISIYPNPAKNELYFDIKLASVSNILIELYTVSGQRIYQLQKDNLPGTVLSIPLENFASGVYLARIIINGASTNRRIVIER